MMNGERGSLMETHTIAWLSKNSGGIDFFLSLQKTLFCSNSSAPYAMRADGKLELESY